MATKRERKEKKEKIDLLQDMVEHLRRELDELKKERESWKKEKKEFEKKLKEKENGKGEASRDAPNPATHSDDEDEDAPLFTEVVSNKTKRMRKRLISTSDEETPGPSTEVPVEKPSSKTNRPAKKPKKAEPETKSQDKKQEGGPKTLAPPPVTVKVDWNEFSAYLKEKKIAYVKAKSVVEGIKIFPQDPDAFRQITKVCRERQIPYFTYEVRENKKMQVVVKGIPPEMQVDDMKAWLVDQGYGDAEVFRMRSKKDRRPLHMLLVKTNNKEIFNITRFDRMVVTVEKKFKSDAPIQCFRCQRFGHVQRNCGFPARCVKCGEDHGSAECERSASQKATCVHCGEQHPASYLGCKLAPVHRNQKAKEDAKKEKKNPKVAQPKEKTQSTTPQQTTMNMNDVVKMFSEFKQEFKKINMRLDGLEKK